MYLPFIAVTFSECKTDEDENLVERLLAENTNVEIYADGEA